MKFEQGRALIIGVANYEAVEDLPAAVRNDALDTAETLKSSAYCGYPERNVTVLTNDAAWTCNGFAPVT
jgi:hypothetical protein